MQEVKLIKYLVVCDSDKGTSTNGIAFDQWQISRQCQDVESIVLMCQSTQVNVRGGNTFPIS